MRHNQLVTVRLITTLGIEEFGTDTASLAPTLIVLPALRKRLAARGCESPGGEDPFLLARPVTLDVRVVYTLVLHAFPIVLQGFRPQSRRFVTAGGELCEVVGSLRLGVGKDASGAGQDGDNGGETHGGGDVDATCVLGVLSMSESAS